MAPSLYKVRLESRTDQHWREMIVEADSPKIARAIALRKESELVAFSLFPAEPVAPKTPADNASAEVMVQYLNARDAYDAADRAYPDRLADAHKVLTTIERDHSFDETGRVIGPSARARAHLHAHHQQQPYKVTSVEPHLPNVAQIVQALAILHQHDGAWEKALQAMKDAGLPLNAVTASLFGLTAQHMIDGSAPIVWSSATIKVALTTSAFTPNQDTHDFFDDVTNEITGTGYTAGGATLGTKTSTYDTATDQIRLDAADTSWTTSTLTARRAVVWDDTAGASSTDPVMGWVDFGADVSTTAGTFLITWDATGIIVYDVT